MNTSNPTLSNNAHPSGSNNHSHARLGLLILCWGLLMVYLILTGAMMNEAGRPPISILLANMIPIGLFVLAYTFSNRVRCYMQTLSPSLLAGLHAMRTIGFSFLVLASLDQLPWLFALPAGIGDIAAAVTAPFIAYFTATQSDFLRSKQFLTWNLFGAADFLVAIGTGSLATTLGPEKVGASMAPMSTLPLMIIPAFLVPLLMITHILMILRAVQERKKL